MRVCRAQGAELPALFQFRHHLFCEELAWFERQPGTQPALHDCFDRVAFNYAAVAPDGSIVGGVRVVPDNPLGLPIEHNLALDGLRKNARLAEISRLAVARPYRGTNLSLLLMKAAYECARHAGHEYLVLDAYLEDGNRPAAIYTRLGFKVLAAPYFDRSYNCTLPVVALGLDCLEAEATLALREPQLHRFFTSPDPRIIHDPEPVPGDGKPRDPVVET